MADWLTITGISASIFTGVSMLPQLIKIIKEKKAGDISVWMLCVLLTGLAFWVAYGILKKDYIIIAANGFSFIVNAIMISMTLKYRSGK